MSEHTCHNMNPPFPYPCAACESERPAPVRSAESPEEPICEPYKRHYWPADASSGDTCVCGMFYLTQLADGRTEIAYGD